MPLACRVAVPANGSGAPAVRDVTFAQDEGPRRDTSLAALGKLKPAFHAAGSVTAGNSSQTSDGAAAVLVTSAAFAKEHGLTPLARFVTYATAGVEPERFGIGPVPAIRKALKLAGLTLDQIDLVELNEAFAAQALACLRELPIDPGPAQRQRRRDRARPPARLHRRQAHDDDPARDAAPRRALRPGDDVRRRRHGRRGYPGTDVGRGFSRRRRRTSYDHNDRDDDQGRFLAVRRRRPATSSRPRSSPKSTA